MPHWHIGALRSQEQALPDERSLQRLAGRRLLLVDDDAMVRSAQTALLAGWQMDVRMAAAPDQARALPCSAPGWVPDCILCDFRLPGDCNGIQLLNELTELYPQAVGILQTGEHAARVQAEADDAGFIVLFKPVSPLALSTTLAAILPATGPTPLAAGAAAA
jgi:DNA-binding NtrC family response regulator